MTEDGLNEDDLVTICWVLQGAVKQYQHGESSFEGFVLKVLVERIEGTLKKAKSLLDRMAEE